MLDLRTTMVHTDALLDLRGGIQSPADGLLETPLLLLLESSAIHSATSQPIPQLNAPTVDTNSSDRE